jgi:hypothetical protein
VTATALLGGQPAHAAVPLAGLQVTVTKSPWCGCCGDYIAILRERGMVVTVIDTEDTAGAKLALGVPPTTWSCHTTEVDGYAVEGHVPLEAIERLLSERRLARDERRQERAVPGRRLRRRRRAPLRKLLAVR